MNLGDDDNADDDDDDDDADDDDDDDEDDDAAAADDDDSATASSAVRSRFRKAKRTPPSEVEDGVILEQVEAVEKTKGS